MLTTRRSNDMAHHRTDFAHGFFAAENSIMTRRCRPVFGSGDRFFAM